MAIEMPGFSNTLSDMDERISNPTVGGSSPPGCVTKQGVLRGVTSDNDTSQNTEPRPNVSVEQSVEVAPKAGFGPLYHEDANGCWNWARCVNSHGYGYFRHNRRHVKAFVWSWERANGPVPHGLELDHTCRNRQCINPAHLEPITHRENCRRGGLVKSGMTIEKAREARAMHANRATHRQIAERLGIGKSLVAQIVTNRCWKESPAPTIGGAS
jgi:hypothetical protein